MFCYIEELTDMPKPLQNSPKHIFNRTDIGDTYPRALNVLFDRNLAEKPATRWLIENAKDF